MRSILEPSFFDRPAKTVGRSLIGKFLVRALNGRELAFPITEVEIYDGFEDRASHAFRGRTPRNQVMFGDAGYFYVYFVYGNHWMLNVVVGKKDYPAAVLVRGLGVTDDGARGQGKRTAGEFRPDELNGPGKLTRALQIDKCQNGKLADPSAGLWFEDRGFRFRGARHNFKIEELPRVGINYAGDRWAKKPYRFKLVSLAGRRKKTSPTNK